MPKHSYLSCSCSASPVQTNKSRSPKSDLHILIQQWRLSRTLYLSETAASHEQCETSGLRQSFDSTRSCKQLLIEASPDRNTWIPLNWWIKKQSTLWELRGQNISWNRSVQVRASKQGVRRKSVAPTFWAEKLLADVLLEFSFHSQKLPFGLY